MAASNPNNDQPPEDFEGIDQISHDAGGLFHYFQVHLDRDPAIVSQTWQFQFEFPNLPEPASLEPLGEQFSSILGPGSQKDESSVALSVFENGAGGAILNIDYEGVMTVKTLERLHVISNQFADPMEIQYGGVTCSVGDVALDADELFLMLEKIVRVDLTEPSLWRFSIESDHLITPDMVQECMDAIDSIAQAGDGAIEASLSHSDPEEEPVFYASEFCLCSVISKDQLKEIHNLLSVISEQQGATYLGVQHQDAAEEFSMQEIIEWTHELLEETANWTLPQIEQIAKPMRDRHIEALEVFELEVADWMPLADIRFQGTKTQLRPQAEIVRRMLAAYAATAWVCAPPELFPSGLITQYIKGNQLKKRSFSKREITWMEMKREETEAFEVEAGWIFENLWGLAWMLGFELTVNPNDHQANDSILGPLNNEFLGQFELSFDDMMEKTQLRSVEQIITLEDLMYCAHNGERNSQNVIAAGIMQERRHPLTWALSPGVLWDDTDVST